MMRTPESLCYGQRLADIKSARRSRVADFRNAPHKLKMLDPYGHILEPTLHITMEAVPESNSNFWKKVPDQLVNISSNTGKFSGDVVIVLA